MVPNGAWKKGLRKNIPILLSELTGAREGETKQVKEILEQARPKVAFYKDAARELLAPRLTRIAPTWKAPECTLTAELMGNGSLKLVGDYEERVNSLAAAMMG